jgi:hypothetical protein
MECGGFLKFFLIFHFPAIYQSTNLIFFIDYIVARIPYRSSILDHFSVIGPLPYLGLSSKTLASRPRLKFTYQWEPETDELLTLMIIEVSVRRMAVSRNQLLAKTNKENRG